jgi:toxin ParE1/3/4
MQVVVTDPAKLRLKYIYRYYKAEASVKTAQKIKDSVLGKIKSLKKFTLRGKIEENLIELNQEHRYVIEGHFKIIYLIYNDTIYVTDIFDTRQNPEKIVKK